MATAWAWFLATETRDSQPAVFLQLLAIRLENGQKKITGGFCQPKAEKSLQPLTSNSQLNGSEIRKQVRR